MRRSYSPPVTNGVYDASTTEDHLNIHRDIQGTMFYL
jgi:hypothetical protein